MKIYLKSCPFCGHSPTLEENFETGKQTVFCECCKFGFASDMDGSITEVSAVARWEHRTSQQAAFKMASPLLEIPQVNFWGRTEVPKKNIPGIIEESKRRILRDIKNQFDFTNPVRIPGVGLALDQPIQFVWDTGIISKADYARWWRIDAKELEGKAGV